MNQSLLRKTRRSAVVDFLKIILFCYKKIGMQEENENVVKRGMFQIFINYQLGELYIEQQSIGQ